MAAQTYKHSSTYMLPKLVTLFSDEELLCGWWQDSLFYFDKEWFLSFGANLALNSKVNIMYHFHLALNIYTVNTGFCRIGHVSGKPELLKNIFDLSGSFYKINWMTFTFTPKKTAV